MTDPLYNAIHRIAHGQVRSYMNDHPETFMHGYQPHVANGIAKRIAGDLASDATRRRLAASLGPATGEAVCECAEGGKLTAQAAGRAPGDIIERRLAHREGLLERVLRWLRNPNLPF